MQYETQKLQCMSEDAALKCAGQLTRCGIKNVALGAAIVVAVAGENTNTVRNVAADFYAFDIGASDFDKQALAKVV